MSFTAEFRAYCDAQGRRPAAQLAHDRKQYPGGCMSGFICWNLTKLAKFKRAHPEACIGDNIKDHVAKVRFLRSEAEKDRAAREFWER